MIFISTAFLTAEAICRPCLKERLLRGWYFKFRKRKTPRDQTKDAGKTSVSPFILWQFNNSVKNKGLTLTTPHFPNQGYPQRLWSCRPLPVAEFPKHQKRDRQGRLLKTETRIHPLPNIFSKKRHLIEARFLYTFWHYTQNANLGRLYRSLIFVRTSLATSLMYGSLVKWSRLLLFPRKAECTASPE